VIAVTPFQHALQLFLERTHRLRTLHALRDLHAASTCGARRLAPTFRFGIGRNEPGLLQHRLQAPTHVFGILRSGGLAYALGFGLEGQEIEIRVLVGTQLRQLVLQRVQALVQLGSAQHGDGRFENPKPCPWTVKSVRRNARQP